MGANRFWKEITRPTLGTIIWSLFFILLSIATSIAVVSGCLSGTSGSTYMVSLNPDEVLGNIPHAPVRGSTVQLPRRYLFGVSGVCRDWTDQGRHNDTKICTSHFPQQFDLLSVVQADIKDENSSQYRAFSQALGTRPIATHQANWNSYTQGAAALLVLSIMWAFATGAVMLAAPVRSYPKYIAALSLLDAVMMLIAAGLWTSAITQAAADYNAPRLFDTYGTINPGPGFWLLWTVCIAKLCIMPAVALVLFVLGPTVCCIACCLNVGAADHDERPGDDFFCEAMCFLCGQGH